MEGKQRVRVDEHTASAELEQKSWKKSSYNMLHVDWFQTSVSENSLTHLLIYRHPRLPHVPPLTYLGIRQRPAEGFKHL